MDNREKMMEVFKDTQKWCKDNVALMYSIHESIRGTKIYREGCSFAVNVRADGTANEKTVGKTEITVTKSRTFEAAIRLKKENPDARTAVHNFASATNPGGGVERGSTAQEECLCRCSTLYPVLKTGELQREFYQFHRRQGDVRYTDTCIYTPDIQIIKTDTNMPQRMKESDWCMVDVITCAAPNLRAKPYNSMNPGQGQAIKVTDKELLEIHRKRARQILNVAAENGVDILVLGAFGCGAFQNKPEVVVRAYREVMKEFEGRFRKVEFAVYCGKRDERNYEVFEKGMRKE